MEIRHTSKFLFAILLANTFLGSSIGKCNHIKVKMHLDDGEGTDVVSLIQYYNECQGTDGGSNETQQLIPTPTDDEEENLYGETVEYDANSNITALQRRGMLNDKTFGLIDDLSIGYSGNHRISVDDAFDESLSYSGAFDFEDGASSKQEYSYNASGALTKDLNRGITSITYDLLGNPRRVAMKGGNYVEYVYAADGTRLKATHCKKIGTTYSTSEKYYRGNFIFDKWQTTIPSTVLFPGGFYFYMSADEMYLQNLYVQDYQGNNRMVVNASLGSFDER